MVLPKSTVHVSRLAATAFKSFSHGYAQTVVAASQSSYASQNTPVAPLASNWLSRLTEKPKGPGQHAHFTTAAGLQAADAAAKDQHVEGGLAHYNEAWQKYHKHEVKEWHHLALARRICWKPPTTIPGPEQTFNPVEQSDAVSKSEPDKPSTLQRSYSTSALNDFAKAIDNDEAEAAAIAQVKESITEERSRRDSPVESTQADHVEEKKDLENINDPKAAARADIYSLQLEQHHRDGQYAQIPTLFEAMLRDGVSQPTQQAYRALIASAVELVEDKHQKAPRVLDIYADMMRRGVIPDNESMSAIIDTLASRALDVAKSSTLLAERQSRLGEHANLFTLDTLEQQMLSSDQTLAIALRLANSRKSDAALSADTYSALITACAMGGQVAEMIALYGKIRKDGASVQTSVYPAMINACGVTGDLRSAVSMYDDYRALAIANNEGTLAMDRIDQDVYAALIQAYGNSGRLEAGKKLLAKIQLQETAAGAESASRAAILTQGILPVELKAGNFDAVYSVVNCLPAKHYSAALETIAIRAADLGQTAEATKAFDALVDVRADLKDPANALCALFIRSGDMAGSERYWSVVERLPASLLTVQLAAIRARFLITQGKALQALVSARGVMASYRASFAIGSQLSKEAAEQIQEAIETTARTFMRDGPTSLEPAASAELLRMMSDNGMMPSTHVYQIMASLSAADIAHCSSTDLDIFARVQAGLLADRHANDVAGPARFGCILENMVHRSVLPDIATQQLIEQALKVVDDVNLGRIWSAYRYPTTPGYSPTGTLQTISPSLLDGPPVVFDDSFDPYISRTDVKGSVVIIDILEKSNARPASALGEALAKFRNIRRAGRHPRFFAYAKLIHAAAKANQLHTAREIVEMAKQDVPLQPQYKIVRHGWIAILDAMTAACIQNGRRDWAATYHQDLLDMGAAPSANTFGLYITSLKETTKTFDEASEAVRIFMRAKSEGVEPTSFLYNALIGKLGKARRIDDSLFYFAEMRSLGIRPTSVTYGTICNALCRVSDEKFAEEIFEEMEASSNYKPRPAPYHSLMQYFLTTKRDRSKVLSYYQRMRKLNIEPTAHTFKLLIDAHATIEPLNMSAAEDVLAEMAKAGVSPEAVHYASLIHAKGCVTHDLGGARDFFDKALSDARVQVQPCIYQALFESLSANHQMGQADALLHDMAERRVEMTPYIVNALIHGWTMEKDISRAQKAFGMIGIHQREPSTYEAMVRAYLAVEDHAGADAVVAEALSRGYPSAVAAKIADLVAGGRKHQA